MNEFKENSNEIPKVQEFSQPLEYQSSGFDDLIKEANTFAAETNDFVKGLTADSKETINVREYGLKECSDAAKRIFTRETFAEWGKINLEQRNNIVREYSKAIGDGLKIDFKGIVFEKMKEEIAGYNSGDGYVHLNKDLLKDPSRIISLIDTIAHEARHQFQFEAIRNPEKYGIDPETIKEWKTGLENYTTGYATEYDPWGYFYNPVELDARYFGESMVRELTKDLINTSLAAANLQQKNSEISFSGSSGYHEDWAKSKEKNAIRAAERGDKFWTDHWAKEAAYEAKKAEEARKAENAKKKGK